ncbi:S-adenosyl-L-methionine-dependent methyltransferase [Pseudovirgaria hyperparasitica]|uniref:DNA (cytosine-5-)-methyltransferase n=1 Tax=Pseudovirgaria hyperparasitica TaxID=470096 RepID=A0A6A6WEU8_9PEZI|nr:S-adenosyl-L-methionine-dependent methyltransferase [Pseudovirgaria hyperparasitica]KAF2760107.1 S-adenosyl-L-methionine-dependent methyltransferase [Pseudovirgaria hyperparasitica]
MCPKSKYRGWTPPLPVSKEATALTELCHDRGGLASLTDHTTLELTEFSIYRPDHSAIHPAELEPLHILRVKDGVNELLFDGVISCGKERRYVKGVSFSIRAVEGYGDLTRHSVDDSVYIQTIQAKACNVWYRLQIPSPEYRFYHETFLWIANLGKHVIDYLESHEYEDVSLMHFRREFYDWMVSQHGEIPQFRAWLSEYGKTDYRIPINAYSDWLWNEAVDIEPENANKRLWTEILPERLSAIESNIVPSARPEHTKVTPFAYRCFKNAYFAEFLQPTEAVPDVLNSKMLRAKQLGFANDSGKYARETPTGVTIEKEQIRVGDVVGTHQDGGGRWDRSTATWFAFVQNIRTVRRRLVLDVIWIYHPVDILFVDYPIKNELFFSTDCNCNEAPFYAEEVTCKIDVLWHPKSVQTKRYFIRQKFDIHNEAFVSFKNSDRICQCRKEKERLSVYTKITSEYCLGDTVLVACNSDSNRESQEPLENQESRLEPVAIESFDDETEMVLVRRFLRRQEVSVPGERARSFPIQANEVVVSKELLNVKAEDIIRRCHVRKFPLETINASEIPTPYDRNGVGDCFYVASETSPYNYKEGPEFGSIGSQSLPGISLFCGGGSFDRGLEEGGATHTRYAIDYETKALHTYLANLTLEDEIQLYLGSVNTYLADALAGKGRKSRLIAKIGDIDFFCAGSPCVGFSTAQLNKHSPSSKQNASLVASVLSYIDLYRPRYGVLENVVPMASTSKDLKVPSIFSQLFFSVVALGYQVQCYILDAWSCGDPQSRSRLFITFAAPGLTLPRVPQLTHSHYRGQRNVGLGVYANGQKFCARRWEPTPFKFTSAKEATRHLPDIGNGRIGFCMSHPDHRLVTQLKLLKRVQISMIPTTPFGSCLASAMKLGLIPEPQINIIKNSTLRRQAENSKAFARVNPDKLFSTVMTRQACDDAHGGASLHWDQHRLLTVEEAKIAQGIPANEVIIGRPAMQYKIIGNGVARGVSVAIGLTFREAYAANGPDFPVPLSRLQHGSKVTMSTETTVTRTRVTESNAISTKKTSSYSLVIERETVPTVNLRAISETPSASTISPGKETNQNAHSTRTSSPKRVLVNMLDRLDSTSIAQDEGFDSRATELFMGSYLPGNVLPSAVGRRRLSHVEIIQHSERERKKVRREG